MNIIILGPQGSGKGTQAKILARKLNFIHLEAGELLRQISKTNPKIESFVNKKGKLIDDETMFNIVKNFLEKQNNFKNILFDGYPRTIKQYKLLKTYLKNKNSSIEKVIFLSIPKKETIKRLSARREDSKTGKIYNLITNPPDKNINIKNLFQREDDKPLAIKKRLQEYQKNTLPLLNLLQKENLLYKINGTKSIQEISNELLLIVKKI